MAVGDGASEKTGKIDYGPIPAPEGYAVDWQTKIEKAKEAWKAGQKARRGKPIAFEPPIGPR